VVPTATSCSGANNGIITVNPLSGTAPYQYSINGGAFQNGNTFTGLAAGLYTIAVKDANGCTTTYTNINVTAGAGINATTATLAASCATASNGSITVTPTSGTGPYQYQLNGGPQQPGNSFTGLAPGTYSVTVTDANNCSVTKTNIIVAAGTGITATSATTPANCSGPPNGSITVTPTTGTGPYQYQLNAGAFQPGNNFTGLAAGPYTVNVRDANNCTVTLNITVPTVSGVSATASSAAATCATASNGSITVNVSAGTAPYQYSLDGGANQPGNIFSNITPGNHSVQVTDGAGCSITLPVTVAAGAGISATATPAATTCATATNGSITVNVTVGSSPYQYSLDGGANQPGNVFSNVGAGNHNITITDAAGCTRVVPVTVAAGSGISATAASAATTCAVATNGSITVNVTVGSAPYQYSLDGGANQPGNVFNNISAGNHNVTITDAAGCTRVVPITVAAGPGITATTAPLPTSCNGASNGSITVTPASGSAPYQYQLDGGVGQGSNIFNNVAAGSHTILVTDANGCTFSVAATVAAGANLTGTTAITHIQCNGNNNGSVTITPTNGGPAYQYAIDGGAFQGSPTFNGLGAGNHTIQLRDGNNCTGSVSINITEPTPVTIGTATTPASCNGQPNGTITITGGGGTAPYQYSINGGALQPGNVFNVAAGTYTALVRDANNCSISASVTVVQPGLLVISATSANATCNGGNNGLITVTANGGNGSLQYSVDGINFQQGNTFNLISGTYTVTVKDANNCTATTNITVGLTNDLLLSTRSDTTICESQSVTLTTTSNALSFAWTPGGSLSDSTIKNPVANPITTTQYIVTATYGVCSAKDTMVVTVNPAPVADAGPGITICYGKTYQLQGSGGTSFFWRPASLLSDPRLASPIATPRNTTIFYLRVVDANGCQSLSEDTAKIIVTPPIVAYAGPDTTVIYGEPYQLNVVTQNSLAAGTSYLWTPSTGLDNPNIPNPLATLFADQVYQVDITTPEGCKGSASVKLRAYKGPDIYVPTAFSPNGDGRNDIFYVVPIGIKYFDYLRIFNRWGQVVFETKLPAIGWEGRFKSLEQPMGTYIYTVQGRSAKGQVIFKKGSILLVR
jgi:gliding motility-associated-like protein